MPFNSRHWKTCRSCNRFYATKICLQTNSFDVTLASMWTGVMKLGLIRLQFVT